MFEVACQADRTQAQTFQLDIRFVDTYDNAERRTVAILLPQ